MPGASLFGKNVVVLGVADESSIAWGVARAFAEQGARVHVGYQQKFFSRIRLLLREFPSIQGGRCDVLKDDEVAAFFQRFQNDPVDILVHAIAYGPPEIFADYPSELIMQGFALTLDVSSYSLCKVVRHVKPCLRAWGSVITLSFLAADRAVPFYGIMGVAKSALEGLVRYLALELGEQRVRVNAISPGAIPTLSGMGEVIAFIRDREALARQRGDLYRSAIGKLDLDASSYPDEVDLAKTMWQHTQDSFMSRCLIKDSVTKEDVAACALFLGSRYSRKITGQVIHVDCGLSSALVL